MSYHHIFTHADGWCQGARLLEGPRPPDQSGVTLEECLAVLDCPPMFHYRDGHLSCAQDDRRAWRELLACHSRADAGEWLQVFRDRRSAVPDDLPADVPIRPRRSSAAAPFPGLPWQSPVPGLAVRELRLDDLDLLSAEAIRLGWEPARCPGEAPCCQPPEAHTWMQFAQRIDQPTAWQFTVEWRGQPIQFELMEQGPPPVSVATYHVTRERSHWFWREAWQPIVAGLRQLGHATCRGLIRGDLGYWVESLTHHYAGRVVGPRPQGGTIVEYDLAAIPFTGWPARRTAGPGWTWTHPGTQLVVREMVETDYDAVARDLAITWGGEGHPALPNVRRILDEQWHLDRATVLVAHQRGQLVGVFSLKPRRPTIVHSAVCSRFGDPQADLLWRVIYRGVLEWAFAAGYTALTGMIPQPVWDAPTFRRALQHTRAQVVAKRRYQIDFVEVTHDLAAIHAESLAAWEAWDPSRPALPDMANVP